MQVHCNEGLASHIGPEPCVDIREGAGEASAGEGVGQGIEPRNTHGPERRRFHRSGRQHGGARDRECADRLCEVKGPGMHRRSLHGNREISRTGRPEVGRSASGRPRRS